jgi:peroxiredoxin
MTEKYDCAFEGRPFSQRVTFLIDEDGEVRMRDEEVSVKTHGPDMVAAIERLQDDE